jgi:hypothetical protein
MWAEVLRGAGISCRVTRMNVEVAAVGFDAWVPYELRVLLGPSTPSRFQGCGASADPKRLLALLPARPVMRQCQLELAEPKQGPSFQVSLNVCRT